MNDVTRILNLVETGDAEAAEQLLPIVYDGLRKLASQKLANEKPGQTLQATALVHEAYLRLVDTKRQQQWNSRGHFFAAAAEAMRRILVEQARRKKTLKAGGSFQEISIADVDIPDAQRDIDLIALDEAIASLEEANPRKAQLVKLRFFAGLTNKQAAELLGISTSTADDDWSYAKSWLRVEMQKGDER